MTRFHAAARGRVALLGLALAALGGTAGGAGPAKPVLLSPAGGESWSAGSRHRLAWRAGGAPVRLDFSADGGRTWSRVAEAAGPEGHLWSVPETVSDRCRLRLTAGTERAESAFRVTPSRRVEYAWVNVTRKAAFAPRDGAGALSFRGRMWLLGGWNPGDKKHFPRICNNEVWSSKDGAEWVLEKPNTFLDRSFDAAADWEGRHTAGYAVFRDRMWIVGGDANQGNYQDDVWSSADGRRWERATAKAPWAPRALHYTAAFRGRLWVMGGQTMPAFAPAPERFYRDIWSSKDGKEWEQVVPREPYWSARGMIGGSAVFRDRIWILGGGTYDTPTTPQRRFHNDVWSSADGIRWRRHLEAAPWEPRQYHEVAVWDGRLWVLEGYNRASGNRSDVWYSEDGVSWYEVPDTPWKPRHAASVFAHAGALWMVAGNNMESDAWKLRRAGAGGDGALRRVPAPAR